VKLRGKEESVQVVELLDQQSATDLTVVGGRPDPDTPSTSSVLFLKYDDDTIQVGEEPIVLGRGSQCDLVIPDSRVSRTHAIIEHERGTFVLKDTSTNGTYVQVGEEDVLFLHRDQLKLHGRGRIRPGRTLDDAPSDPDADASEDAADVDTTTIFFACESGED
jgi:pSer/pThr/pTyr-binding forkhead associated (FHA) protein